MRVRGIRMCLVACVPLVGSIAAQAPTMRTGRVELAIGQGADEAREPYLFEDVTGLHFGPAGEILVASAGANAIRVFSRDGTFRHQIGRPGKGPGDLDDPCCLAFDARGRLWVAENGNRRYSIFVLGASTATFQQAVPLPDGPTGLMPRIEWSVRGRPLLVSSYRDPRTGAFGSVRRELRETGAIVAVDTVRPPDADSLAEQAIERTHARDGQRGRGVSVISQPFGPRALRAFGPRGTQARAISSNYAVAVLDGDGRRTALITRSVPPIPLSPAERRSAEDILSAAARSNGVARSAIRLDVPARKAPLRALGFDLDGRLWVQRSVPDGALSTADVHDVTGKLLFTATWPRDVDLSRWAIRGSEALGVRYDAEGVPQPVRLVFR